MSAVTPQCDFCKIDRVFVRVAPLGHETSYAVEWRCASCKTQVLDICPLGPLAPTRESCLNCGEAFPDLAPFARCNGCGLTRLATLDIFGLDPAPADPIGRAEKYFDLGLVRRAIATLDHALLADPSLEPAWRIKYAFLSGLGFTRAALAVIEAATEHVVNPDLLISYAVLLEQLDRRKEAIDVYREYLATAPQGEYAALALQNLERSARILHAGQRTVG